MSGTLSTYNHRALVRAIRLCCGLLIIGLGGCGGDESPAAPDPTPQAVPSTVQILGFSGDVRIQATEESSSGRLCMMLGGTTGRHQVTFLDQHGSLFPLDSALHSLTVTEQDPSIAEWQPDGVQPFSGNGAGFAVGETGFIFKLTQRSSGQTLFQSAPAVFEVRAEITPVTC